MRTLKDIKIIDLEKSVLDDKLSDPNKDLYVFKKKVYSKYPFASERYKFKWGRHTADGRRIDEWRYLYNADFVIPKDKMWPEGLKRNAEGHYQFGDAVLMKVPLADYIAQKKDEMQRSNRRSKAMIKKHQADVRKVDKGAVMSDEEVAETLGFEPILK